MTEIIKVDPRAPLENVVERALFILKKGRLVIYPTDTVYGLGADPFNPEAVERVYKAKARRGKPLPILVSSIEAAEKLVFFTPKALKVVEELWPGALTLILEAKDIVLEELTLGTNKLGVRMPDSLLAQKLAEGLGGWIVGTSANRSGSPSPCTAEEAVRELGRHVDLVLDGGLTPLRMPSTILDLTVDPPVILRVGPIEPSVLEDILGVSLRIQG